MRTLLRLADSFARTGGEEFAILLPETTELAALAIAERVRQAVEELTVPLESGPIKLTVCAGVAQMDADNGWEEMMHRADAAMYEAKKHGRNLVSSRIASGFLNSEFRDRFELKTCRYIQAALNPIQYPMML